MLSALAASEVALFTSFSTVFLIDFRIGDEVLDVFKLVRPSIEALTYRDINDEKDNVIANDSP